MQEVEYANTSEGLGDDVGEDGGRAAGVHGWETPEDVVQLREGVDCYEDVGYVKAGVVPENHPCCGSSLVWSYMQGGG